jgi:hypothetical protein
MKYLGLGLTAAALAFAGLAGCAGSSAGNNGASNAGAMPGFAAPAVARAFEAAGQYEGTVTDSALGNGKVSFDLSRTGASAGGSLRETFATKTIRSAVAMSVASNDTLSGTAIALLSNPCSLQIDAKYNRKTHVLSGTYSAFHRCSGQTGTFRAKEQCYYVVTKPAGGTQFADRPNTVRIMGC